MVDERRQDLDQNGRRWVRSEDLPDWFVDTSYFRAKLTPDQIVELRRRLDKWGADIESFEGIFRDFDAYVRLDDERNGRKPGGA